MTGSQLSDTTERDLSHLAIRHQAKGRVPGLVAAVARRGEVRWSRGVGSADLDRPDVAPDADMQYPIASNTKTFVAVLILQLRDEGKLRLDDPLDVHVPESTHAGVTIRQLLAHSSGMTREPVGDVWDTLTFPTRAELVPGWNSADRVGGAHDRWHYSNLGFAMLGEVIARIDGREWHESLHARLLDPLGLRRTSITAQPPVAAGYFVPPFDDVPRPEQRLDIAATGPAGALWSTATDLATWHAFLSDPATEVLSPDTVEEMLQPQIVADTTGWSTAWGLGLQLVRRDRTLWVGHTGGFPGSITAAFTQRDTGTTGVVLMNNSAAPDPSPIAIELGELLDAREPAAPDVWTPGTQVPDDLVPLLGRWFSEGRAFSFAVRAGQLEARVEGAPEHLPPSVFERESADEFRTVSGRERGERLVIDRYTDGSIRQLNWATYPFTREPLAFGQPLPRH